jgi:hypothetical protein
VQGTDCDLKTWKWKLQPRQTMRSGIAEPLAMRHR